MIDDIFEDGYVEPKQEEKEALIKKLQSGDYTLSFSSLSAFAVSPAAFVAYRLQEQKTTKAMIFGEAVHCLLLEPERFRDQYYIAPNVNGATVEGKNEWAKTYMDFTGEKLETNKQGNYVPPKQDEIITKVKKASGITILPGQVYEDAKFRARKITANRACRYVLDQVTETERKVTFEFEGIKFTGRIDGNGERMIMDIKNMPDATLYKATQAVWSRRLHWQSFGYDAALNFGNRCHILAVDGQGETSVHCFSQSNLDAAERQMKRYCSEFKRCIVESLFDPTVFDSSQDFWLRTELNEYGINYL